MLQFKESLCMILKDLFKFWIMIETVKVIYYSGMFTQILCLKHMQLCMILKMLRNFYTCINVLSHKKS